MRISSLNVGKSALWTMGFVAAAALTACGGNGDPVKVVAADVPVVVANTPAAIATAKAVVASIATAAVAVPIPVSAATTALFGTTSAATFTLSPSTVATEVGNFAIKDASNNSYSGSVEAGSCILVIKVSSFVAPSPYAVGGKITVNPCSFTAKVAGVSANGTQTTREVVVTLGTNTSSVQLPVTVAANGQVSFGNNVITTVTPVNASGS